AIFNPVHTPIVVKSAPRQNIVIIILESFNREYMGGYYASRSRKGYTPFLDSLMNHSCVFLNAFANGRKSIEAMPSILASIPSLGEPFITTQYSADRFNSIPGLLRKQGYHTSLFHGAPNGSMGFNSFGNLAGIEHYYGMTEYGNDKDFDGMWGIWDEEFLQFYSRKLNTFPQPFASVVYTVSSHHPYKIPAKYENRFPKGNLLIHKGIGYTDFALRRFFHKISKMPWYKNTLFVITADHANPMTEFPEFRTGSGLFAIPLLFYKPDDSLKGVYAGPAQQSDIMPTVLNYMGNREPYVSFGNDLFTAPHASKCVNYLEGIWQLTAGDYILQFDGVKTRGLFLYKSDKLMRNNLVGKVGKVQNEMESYLKAFIQQYNSRMINDRLAVKK
ncbi:MAG: LTA synthase family protein, partial [Bacteroidota bacterium]|nr:LTA synthase family protein [Bacteroidota bacterium]